MIAVIQRVSQASVDIQEERRATIGAGFLVLLGIEEADGTEDIDWLTKKIANLRIFSDSDGKMNLSLKDIRGELLVISQFTLHASTKKGNRPSFIRAARPEVAIPLYEQFIRELQEQDLIVKSGEFGADMQVSLINNGPVTITIDTKNRV